MQRSARILLTLTLVCLGRFSAAAEPRAFREGRFEKAELKYVRDVPVLLVQGTPAEIGRQKAALTGAVVTSAAGDRRQCAVLEITPKTLAIRHSHNGVCACTNHFRTKELASFAVSHRYGELSGSEEIKTISVGDIANKLNAVNEGFLTVQTMIFEPGPLDVHVSLGPPTVSDASFSLPDWTLRWFAA